MKETFDSLDEAKERLKELVAEQKWAFTLEEHEDGKYTVYWYQHKRYIGEDGKEYPDEVWDSREGAHVFVQDLTLEEMQAILRNILKENRELTQVHHLVSDSVDGVCDQITDILGSFSTPSGEIQDSKPKIIDEWNNPLYHEAPKTLQ